MTMRKITLSLPEPLIEAAETAVAAGHARSVSAYVAAVAGAGEARWSLAEVLRRWETDAEPVSPETASEAQAWVTSLTARSDRRYATRHPRHPGRAA